MQHCSTVLRCVCSVAPSSGGKFSYALCFQHEAVHSELREKQEDMDQLISTAEDLQRELEKVPTSGGRLIQKQTDALRNQWLEVTSTQ